MNSGNSANDDSRNVLMITGVASSGAGGSVMIAVSSGDSATSDLFLTSAGVSSDGDGGLLRLTSSSSSFRNVGAVTIVGGESLVSNE